MKGKIYVLIEDVDGGKGKVLFNGKVMNYAHNDNCDMMSAIEFLETIGVLDSSEYQVVTPGEIYQFFAENFPSNGI